LTHSTHRAITKDSPPPDVNTLTFHEPLLCGIIDSKRSFRLHEVSEIMNTSPVARIGWLKRRPAAILASSILVLVLVVLAWRWRFTSTQSAVTGTAGQWTRIPSPLDGKIHALLINDQRTLYAATNGGVFKSDNGGRRWVPCNNGLTDRLVHVLAFDPDNPDVLYAGTWNGRVYISTDAGQSWQERSRGLPPYEIRGLAVHTHDPRRLYVGSRAGVYTTISRGEQWRPAGRFTGTLQCVAMDPDHPDTLYVGTMAHGIQRSTDGGATWSSLTTAFTDVSSLVILPRLPDTIYAISTGKVHRTESAGTEWTYVDYWRDHDMARSLAVNPQDTQEVYVGLQDGLHKSIDARQSWFRSEQGIKGIDVRVLAVDPIETNTVYACTGNRLFISTDASHTWTHCSSIDTHTSTDVLVLEGDPKDGDVFYASVAGAGVYRTADRGDHWEHVGESLPLTQITAVEADPINAETVYLGIEEGLVFKSVDGGATLEPAGAIAEAPVSALAVDPEQPERVYAGTRGQGLFRSDDSGRNWARKGNEIGNEIQRIVIDSGGPHTTVYALTERGVFRSHDAGEYWESYLSTVADIALPARSDTAPVVVAREGMDYVKGHGLSQVVMVPNSRVAPDAQIKGLIAGPSVSQTLYVLVEHQGVFQSTDLGATWASLGTGLESLQLRAIALSADDPHLILVGTDKGIYRYEPAGQ